MIPFLPARLAAERELAWKPQRDFPLTECKMHVCRVCCVSNQLSISPVGDFEFVRLPRFVDCWKSNIGGKSVNECAAAWLFHFRSFLLWFPDCRSDANKLAVQTIFPLFFEFFLFLFYVENVSWFVFTNQTLIKSFSGSTWLTSTFSLPPCPLSSTPLATVLSH